MFIPAPGTELTVTLPGEVLRAEVRKVVDRDRLLVHLHSQPMTRGHLFRKGDIIGCVRRTTPLGELWEAQDDRAFLASGTPAEPEPAPARRAPKDKPVTRRAARKPEKPTAKRKGKA